MTRKVKVNGISCEASKTEAMMTDELQRMKPEYRAKVASQWIQTAPTMEAQARRKAIATAFNLDFQS